MWSRGEFRVRLGRIRPVVIVAAVGVVLVVGGTSDLSAATTDTINVGPAANGSQRRLHRGDVLVVRLPSNPSTGYTWKVCCGTRTLLVVASRTYLPPRDEQLVGAPGKAVLRFRAVKAGKTVLRLHYVRSWEKGAVPARTFALRVTVVYH
jgi:inhibitor of cysteine peptidase